MDAWWNCPGPKPGPTYSLAPGPGQTIQISSTGGAPTVQQNGVNGAAGTVVVPTNGDQKPATGQNAGSGTPPLGSVDADAPDGDDTQRTNSNSPSNSNGNSNGGQSSSTDQNSQSSVTNYQPTTANYEQLTDQLNADGTPKKKGFDWEGFLAQMSGAIQQRQGLQNGYPADYDLASSRYGYGSEYGSGYPVSNYGASTETPGTTPPAPASGGIGRGSGVVFGGSQPAAA